MCGIAGEIRTDGAEADRDVVGRMTAALAARGPDGEGLWSDGPVALGHRRLSIIDLSDASAQPMTDDAAGLAIVFNGCIYNHRELRAELGPQCFRTSGDTEVILRAYERWGLDFVQHLVGMFAIVLVDRAAGRVVLVRDRLGIKPLYVTRVGAAVRVASTLPALLAGGGVDTRIDDVALHHYLSWHSIVPAPRTILRGVRKLPPATLRVIDRDGSERDLRYWEPRYERDPERASWSDADWREAVHDALRTAVRRRTVADVPVGVLLSGGVDSSLIVELLAEEGLADGIETFSIGFEDRGGRAGDEFRWSDAVAQRFGTAHHRLRVGVDDLPSAVCAAVGAMSEPMGTHDATAFFLLARAVSEHVTVVQSGQGADEVFGGYGYHRIDPGARRKDAYRAFTRAFRDRPHRSVLRAVEDEHALLEDPSGALVKSAFRSGGADTPLDVVLRLDTHVLMPDDPVKRVDTMTMAWGVEARVPFLDHELVELVAAAPPHLKSGRGGKTLLKDIARPLLPEGVVDRPKGYFPVPDLLEPTGPLLDLVEDALDSETARGRGLLRRGFVDEMLVDPGALLPTGGNRLWQLAVLELWLQEHGIR
ncbi:N-acetylglutaminylglutamine amidotransferase [Rathayibacter sp. VKM Ac-2630]|uniref:N-acetylglutaminylglutamine amidotransferase n=1 Tax=Rathayibacter sp. VKM Ac-2630 TaxID=1938617 RepID=UPI000981874A|nr:N-acetylglutaminylglutamine amidotransferase [Rathayibacter sp. VKM Ac-2630]OOB90092.1 asparagine synthase (glutamine-hydrolyzing) [Rathayibacter sp. VKM Ac-2630]